ncbi:hypothetical protein EYF80_054046 [Liparis tanakae]|uniref:Uncharacterized protein n=1 Tax=Liparis tanakae TaxID=230148 RepID=A0A4Z2F5L7_9TELE|nr:hypothetical protein EYF80_054046 [Liparis tanakae]
MPCTGAIKTESTSGECEFSPFQIKKTSQSPVTQTSQVEEQETAMLGAALSSHGMQRATLSDPQHPYM